MEWTKDIIMIGEKGRMERVYTKGVLFIPPLSMYGYKKYYKKYTKNTQCCILCTSVNVSTTLFPFMQLK